MELVSSRGFVLVGIALFGCAPGNAEDYVVVDTEQALCYDNAAEVACPVPAEPFYGQDAQYQTRAAAYLDNGDGTISDLTTGLMWQKSPDFATLREWTDAQLYADAMVLAGYDDWRAPTLKELYSLIDFNGSSFFRIPYIDTSYFDFEYPPPESGLRDMDCQYWSSTVYVGTTMNNDPTAFGVNFADGRIKGYPKDIDIGGTPFARYIRCVRGGSGYGVNNFVDNGDGTITDSATGLMWMKADSPTAMNWEQSLDYAENLDSAGYDDWRLPDAKELQSIVDYTRAPDAVNPASQGPALDPVFDLADAETWAWTSTTHLDGPSPNFGVYVCFGLATGWMEQPPNSGNYVLMNVHGAGAQRSDPKVGDPGDYPFGHGPQGDVVRIFSYVRAVRDVQGGIVPTVSEWGLIVMTLLMLTTGTVVIRQRSLGLTG